MPGLQTALREVGTLPVPAFRSIGAGADGHFHTAALKEYPPLFCKAIAIAMLQTIEQAEWNAPLDAAAAKFCAMVMPFDVYWEMGADFWG